MKIGICDENHKNRYLIKKILQSIFEEEKEYLLHPYTPNEVLIDMEERQFDCEVLILNTEYRNSDMDGVTLAKRINEAFPFCKIIYLTENENAIKDVYETKHCYFVRQKDMEQVLPLAMQKAMNMLKQESDRKAIEIICEGHHVFINRADIIYIEKCGRTIHIVTNYREYICYESLSGIQKQLSSSMVRAHGGYIVNLAYITYLSVEHLEVQNGKIIPIGRTYDKNIRKCYQEYWKNKM